MSTATELDTRAVLARARRAQDRTRRAQAELLETALEWAHAHVVEAGSDVATWGDSPVSLAGEGAPQVESFCVIELGAALSMTSHAAQSLVADALELAHRLPRVWALVVSGRLVAWRARGIAAATRCLSVEAAAYVDQQVAPFASRLTPAELGRVVDAAIARFMPEEAARRRRDAADGRHVTVDHEQVSFAGTSRVEAELDLADALDLDARIAQDAEHLADLGSQDSLDARRAVALGHLARGERPLPLDTGAATEISDKDAADGRTVVLHAHLPADALADPDAAAFVREGGGRLVSAEQVRAWCCAAGRIIVKPVIDLAADQCAPGYAIPDRIREQVELRDRTCVFPWCTRPADRCDLDHVIAYADGGPTAASNLAPLCRRHHRAKTHPGRHGIWAYEVAGPGTYLWTSPLGHHYLRDTVGTTDLTAPTVPPPDT